MMNQIIKITKEEARITAKLYIYSIFASSDGFNADDDVETIDKYYLDEVNHKVQLAINAELEKIMRSINIDAPTSSLDCIIRAKEFVKQKQKNK